MPRLQTAPAPEAPDIEPAAEPEAQPAKKATARRSTVAERAKSSAKPAAAGTDDSVAQIVLSEVDDWGFLPLDDTIDYLRVMLYGREGTSKTTSGAFMANLAAASGGGRVLVINAEAGLKKIALRKRGVDTSRIMVWPPEGERVTAKSLEKLHEKLAMDLRRDPESWYGVMWDSLTEIYQALREQATGKRLDKMRRDPAINMDVVNEEATDRDDYGVMTNQMRKLVRQFRGLPCHLVITALERTEDKTGVVGPAVNPALATDVMGWMDLVLYCRASQHAAGEDEDESLAEFRALTRQGKVTRAKDRFDMTPRVLAEPRFDRILGYVMGEITEESDPIQAAYVARREAEAAAKAEQEREKEERKAAAKRPGTDSSTDTEGK